MNVKSLIAAFAAAVSLLLPVAEAAAFDTAQPPQLVPTESGVTVDPILTTGDIVGDYQMSGRPDGLGAYRPEDDELDVFMNHELSGTPSDARVTRLALDSNRRVDDVRYVVDGTEGYKSFCSASLSTVGGVPTYFTGEEALPGRSIAIDTRTETVQPTTQFGFFEHENTVAMSRLKFGFFLNTEDGPPGHSQLYAYSAGSVSDAVAGEGQLLVWKADGGADSPADVARGQTLQGRFVPLSQADNTDAATLEAAAQREGAFNFTRLEDVAQGKTDPTVAYFTDTGDGGSETKHGRLYKIDIDASSGQVPTAWIKPLLDGDAGDDLVNPDNIDTSKTSVVIEEDRNPENRGADVSGGYGRVLVYDLATGELRQVARVDTPATQAPGTWEASGILNASQWLGSDWWLLDVQAHSASKPQPGPSLVPDSSTGEDGQLLAIRIPHSAPTESERGRDDDDDDEGHEHHHERHHERQGHHHRGHDRDDDD